MNSRTPHKVIKDQRGMASFIITIFIMMVLGLMVIGFAQLTRRDQRQSLDRQLSTQAYYAAETGVNDAIRYLQTNPGTDKADCSEAAPGQLLAGYNNVLDAATGVSYQCVLIDSTPGDLQKQDVNINSNVVFPVELNSGNTITSITFSWRSKIPGATSSGCPAPGSYPSAACQIPTLRADIVPYGTAANPSRDSLLDSLFTVFANPSSGGSVAYATNAGSNPTNAGGSCSGPSCTITVTGLSADRFFVRLNSIYGISDVTITASDGNAATTDELVGAQAMIDVTGKASDVVKRIQVRVPITGTDGIPGFALQSANSQCKRFGITPPNKAYLIEPPAPDSLETECRP